MLPRTTLRSTSCSCAVDHRIQRASQKHLTYRSFIGKREAGTYHDHSTITPQTIRARDVYEAVGLARELQQAGRYNWFRGQSRNWPLCSSLNRVDEESLAVVCSRPEFATEALAGRY